MKWVFWCILPLWPFVRYTWTVSRHAFAPSLALDVATSLNADESHHVTMG